MPEDDDLYDGGGMEDFAPTSTDTAPDPEQGEPMGEPQLVNKELCEDCQPGEKLIVEVIAVHGKELEIRLVNKQDASEEDGPPPEEMDPAESSSMMD